MRLFMGYDPVERRAYQAAIRSLRDFSQIDVQPLDLESLRARGILTRLHDGRGQLYDLASNAPCSTEFAISRFLTPLLCQTGYAMFVDCDVIFQTDPLEVLQYIDPEKAVSVVKHHHKGAEGHKMGGMVQTAYRRKNWSSVMVFNCDHPANRRLTLHDVNNRPGRDLHAFYWLHDDEIGALPNDWNWLVNVQQKPRSVKIAHFTLGGPWLENWTSQPNDELWLKYG